MAEFVRVASESDLPAGTCLEVELRGRLIALFNVKGAIHAIDGVCPHAGGPLGAGSLDGAVVTCPWHGWQFDVATGRNIYNSSCAQQVYQVKVEGGDILLALP